MSPNLRPRRLPAANVAGGDHIGEDGSRGCIAQKLTSPRRRTRAADVADAIDATDALIEAAADANKTGLERFVAKAGGTDQTLGAHDIYRLT